MITFNPTSDLLNPILFESKLMKIFVFADKEDLIQALQLINENFSSYIIKLYADYNEREFTRKAHKGLQSREFVRQID